jgi:hypothetical protein
MFTVMDGRDFVDVFTGHMPAVFDTLLAEPDMLIVAAHLVQSQQVGRSFSAILAEYLTNHQLHTLKDPGSKEAMAVQKLMKFVFLGLQTPDGELPLVGTLVTVVDKCMQAVVHESDPTGHLGLLRSLFKICTSSREAPKQLFERLSGKLAGMLSTFLAMLHGPNCTEVGGVRQQDALERACASCVGGCALSGLAAVAVYTHGTCRYSSFQALALPCVVCTPIS